MSTRNAVEGISLYIQRLKTHFQVKTDEELATRLRMSKQNIANWRRRGAIPKKTLESLHTEHGIMYTDRHDVEATRQQMSAVYASALFSAFRFLKSLEHEPTVVEWQRLGDSFAFIAQALRGYVAEERSPVMDTKKLIAELIAEEDGNGRYYSFLKRMMEDDFQIPG